MKACALEDGLCKVESDVIEFDQVLFSGEKELSVVTAVVVSRDV